MQSLTVFSILAIVIFSLGPLLSTANPIPPHAHPECTSKGHACTGPPENLAAIEFDMAIKCNERAINHYLNCVDERVEHVLSLGRSRAQLLLSRDLIIDEIRRLKSMNFDRLSAKLQLVRQRNFFLYMAWIARMAAFDMIVTELNKFADTEFPYHTVIAMMFDGTKTDVMPNHYAQAFYYTWVPELIQTNDLEGTLTKFQLSLTEAHSILLLQQFRGYWAHRRIEEINADADLDESVGRKTNSEMKIIESLLLRYIRVRAEPKLTASLLELEVQRLNALRFPMKWPRLNGLLHWLHLQYTELHRKTLQ
ncbi:hypothetical protein H0H93_005418 [Arthromyces matolae]|nr:hypothetical protein H0H93_005418 [Arthromyces matolae]